MSYVQVSGDGLTVRWQDGEWTGPPHILDDITRAQKEPIYLTPTGPEVPADSARAAVYLAAHVLNRVETFETDIPYELDPLPPGVVS